MTAINIKACGDWSNEGLARTVELLLLVRFAEFPFFYLLNSGVFSSLSPEANILDALAF